MLFGMVLHTVALADQLPEAILRIFIFHCRVSTGVVEAIIHS
ncbi:hypothetical protein DVDV_1353 [Desulfovibrio sp. DV]|nr:hypothetical protein DVDV_1353 [Desulfovibrio sp. DV]